MKRPNSNSKFMHAHFWTTMYRWLVGIPLDTVLSFILFRSHFLQDWRSAFNMRISEAAQTVSTHTIYVQFTLQTRFGKWAFFQSSGSLRFHRFHIISILRNDEWNGKKPETKQTKERHVNGTVSFARANYNSEFGIKMKDKMSTKVKPTDCRTKCVMHFGILMNFRST